MDLSPATEQRLRRFFKGLNRFMVLLWRLGWGPWGFRREIGGQVMVIKHTGRKTGLTRYAPVNYAVVGDAVYCTAAFGRLTHWYQNLLANPSVEVWLPDGRWTGRAEDVSDSPDRIPIVRQIMIASGFVAPLFGIHVSKLSDAEVDEMARKYRLIRIRPLEPVTGPGGPGDLGWIWPLTTMLLAWLLLRRRRKPNRAASSA